jgi:DNA/RNA endonuclease G (NUC1)
MNMRNTAFFWTAVVAWIIGGCAPTSGRGDTFADPVSRVDNKAKMLELPAYDKSEHVLEYDGFTVSYNHTTLVPNWVAYELLDEELNGSYNTRSSNFSRDPNLVGEQASREDYSHSG